jgi:hypothetical protein
MISKSLRIRIFNWLGAGKLTLIDDTKENKMTGTVGGYQIHTTNNTGLPWPNTSPPASYAPQPIDLKGGINLTVTPATGGWIVQINQGKYNMATGAHQEPQLYIVPEEQDLGAELGKIITMSCLKE